MAHVDPRYKTARWQQLRRTIIRRDGGRCTTPGCTSDPTQPRTLHVDHIHEIKDGGPFWEPTNLTTLCRLHHTAKTLAAIASRSRSTLTSPDA